MKNDIYILSLSLIIRSFKKYLFLKYKTYYKLIDVFINFFQHLLSAAEPHLLEGVLKIIPNFLLISNMHP